MTPTTKAYYNADEAKKELLATLHASRELGPEMDDTLTDRYMDRLKALRPAGSYDPTRVRADLAALLQSARGSDPVGDDALAEDFLAHLKQPLPAAPAYMANPPAPQTSGPQSELAHIVPVVVAGAIIITAIVFVPGHPWWLIFFLSPMLGWLRGGSRRSRRDRYRYRYDRELGGDDPYHRLPPSSNPPEIL